MPDSLDVIRPTISLIEILGYSFIAFLLGLVLTKPFLGFLHKYKLGKQLRVQAVDGGTASVFLTYHKDKAGTPTMGGILIWVSIVITILLSRVFSLFGQIDNSLLQRGQVYIPLAILLGFGILGALDDYLNILNKDPEKLNKSTPLIKRILSGGWLLIVGGTYFVIFRSGGTSSLISNLYTDWLGIILIVSALIFLLCIFDIGGSLMNPSLKKLFIGEGKKAGLNALPKLFFLIALSLVSALWFYLRLDYQTLHVPFAEMWGFVSEVNLGWWYIPFFMFVVIGTANAVNVTDGLDGLAGGLLIIAFSAFAVMAYLSGLIVLSGFCGVVVGALAAFLWHNVPPAAFFMGDTGSMALGGTLAILAFMVDQVLVLPLIGFVFVIEMLSVIIQLTSKRLRKGKKVFKSAPFHHHLEALEWGESKVTMRLWIVGAFTAFLGVLVAVYG